MKMHPVNWFEIPVLDMKRAMKFYEAVFGYRLDLQDEEDGYQMAWFPMERDLAGSTGTLFKGKDYIPSHEGTTVYFSVEDIEDTLKKAEENGGKTLLPKRSIGEHGFTAWFEDSEGNRIALHSMK